MACPATRTFIIEVRRRARTGFAAHGQVARIMKGIIGQLFFVDVCPDILFGPTYQWVDFKNRLRLGLNLRPGRHACP